MKERERERERGWKRRKEERKGGGILITSIFKGKVIKYRS
jgi:hypothetical protein